MTHENQDSRKPSQRGIVKKVSFRFKISVIFFVFAAFITGALFASLYFQQVRNQTERIRKDLLKTAVFGASLTDGDQIRALALDSSAAAEPYFSYLVKKLKFIKATDPNINDVYVLVPVEGKPAYRWLSNANRENEPVICGEIYDAARLPALLAGRYSPAVDERIYQDKWGSWISGYAPIFDGKSRTAAVLGVDMAAHVFELLKRNFLGNYAVALILTLLLALLVGFISSGYLSKPVDSIVQGMEKVGQGDLEHKLSVHTGDEFEKISGIFNQMTASLKDNIEKLTTATREKERMNRELEIAAELQKKALPRETPQAAGIDIAGDSVAALEVGGDYFDYLTSRENEIGFVIADAAGKGLPGTIFMTNSRSIFRVVSRDNPDPSCVLKKANDYICADSGQSGIFITLFYGVYDLCSRKFTYANAGHNPQILFRCQLKDGFRLLESSGTPLGILEGQEFPGETVELRPGDLVLMYTDGVVEAEDEQGQMFGLSRLIEIVRQHADQKADFILSVLKSAIKDFAGTRPQFDDITVIIFKVL